MNGLRVYSRPQAIDSPLGEVTFYSRRAHGPYYRWRYENVRGRWMSARIDAIQVSMKEFTVTPWKMIPDALKSSLKEHYLE
jgi:hypothetical protein